MSSNSIDEFETDVVDVVADSEGEAEAMRAGFDFSLLSSSRTKFVITRTKSSAVIGLDFGNNIEI